MPVGPEEEDCEVKWDVHAAFCAVSDPGTWRYLPVPVEAEKLTYRFAGSVKF